MSPELEKIIQRSLDGNLAVEFKTSNSSSFQTLVASQTDLKQLLEQKETSEVRLVVNHDGAEDNDHNRRSRGYIPEDTTEQ